MRTRPVNSKKMRDKSKNEKENDGCKENDTPQGMAGERNSCPGFDTNVHASYSNFIEQLCCIMIIINTDILDILS